LSKVKVTLCERAPFLPASPSLWHSKGYIISSPINQSVRYLKRYCSDGNLSVIEGVILLKSWLYDIYFYFLSGESLKQEMDEAALVIKTAYCELPTYNVIIPKMLEVTWKDLPKYCHITPGINIFWFAFRLSTKKDHFFSISLKYVYVSPVANIAKIKTVW